MQLLIQPFQSLAAFGKRSRARARLLAAALFAPLPNAEPVTYANRVEPRIGTDLTPARAPQEDLFEGLNLAGQAAGIQVWDWDLVTNTLKFNNNVMNSFGGDVQEAQQNPGDFIARAVHPEDIEHYRLEFIRALKGAPLCIDYRVLHKDGSAQPVQLRGQVFRGPAVNGEIGRATRVVGFTIDMRSKMESARRMEKQHEQQQQLIERLSLAAESAGIGVWDWDLKTNRLRSDTHMARVFDQADADSFPTAQEFTAKIVHPDDVAAFNEAMENAVHSADRFNHRYRHQHADGSIHHVQLHGRVLRSGSKKPLRLIAITWDITAEVEAQQKIGAQAEQLQLWIDRIGLASETAGIGMWDWDLATGKLSSDTHMAGLFPGANLSGVENARDFVARILHPDDREAFTATMQNAMAYGGPTKVGTTFRYIGTNGDVHHIELNGRIVRNANGRTERFLGISWNITDKMEAQAEAERQSAAQQALLERLNLATETAGIDVWDWDLVNDIFVADAHMTGAYGGTRFEFKGGRDLIQRVVHPDDIAEYERALDNALAKEDSLVHRYRMLLADGTLRHVQVHARVFRNDAGTAVRVLGTSLNITEQVERLAELRFQADEERALRDRLNLATKTAGISIWDKDLLTGAFNSDDQFWKIFGLPADNQFKPHDGIHPDERMKAIEPMNAALADPACDEILAIRHRSSNPRPDPQFIQSHMRVFRDERGVATRLLGVTWDVTDAEMRAQELQRKANHERALIERLNISTQAAGISPWEFDIKTNRFSWHGPRLACFGMDDVPLEEYYQRLHSIVLPEDLPLMSEPARDALENGRDSYEYRFRVNGPDGKIHHVHNYARILRSERGNVRFCVGVTWDVTKEVEAAAQLREQAEFQSTLLNRLSVATQAAGISPWEFDLKSNQYSWFGERLSVLGLDDEPLPTYYEAIARILLPEDRMVLHDAATKAISNNIDVYSARYRAMGIDGKVHYLKNFVRVLRGKRGTPYKLVGVTWDVTDEVAVNEKLEAEVQQANALRERLGIATLAAGISPWEFDLKSNKLIWLGVQLKAIGLEHVPLESYMQELYEVTVPEDKHVVEKAVREAVVNDVNEFSYRFRARGTSGSIHHLKNYVRVLRGKSGKPKRLVGVTWDISEEVAASERLEQQAQHEQALKERLSIAAQAAGISPFEIDLLTGKFLWVENPLKAMAGSRDQGNELTRYSSRIHPDDVAIFREEIIRAAKGGYDIIKYRYRGIGNDDNIVHIQTYAKLYFNDQRRATRALGVSWDVTKEVDAAIQLQHQAEHERQLLERLNIATESAGISTWEIDLPTAKFLWIENPLKSVQRENDEDLTLDRYTDRILPADRQLMPNAIKGALRAKSNRFGFRYRAFTLDGNGTVHVQTFGRVIVDDSGRPMRLLGVSWDVTREVEAAERLQNVERRLERASLSSSEGHWEAELATGHLWCSSSFHTLLGYRDGEIETRVSAFDRLINGDDSAVYHDALHDHLVNQSPYDIETRLLMASGEYRWFRMRGMAERNADGQPIVMAGSIHDVHQQKLIEDALSLAQRRFERAINGTQDGLWELEVGSDATWCSPRLAMLLGYTVSEIESRNFLRELIHPDDAAKVEKVTESHYRFNTPFDLELRLRMRSGDHRWYRARASAERDTNGRATRLSGSLQDVTEARAAREELVRATAAAEAASSAKSAFLANVSHEIRTPMNGIIGMTGLLIDTQLDRTQRDYANTIRGSADSLLTVINDILDFSKIEAGKLDLENIEMDLRANVEDVGSMMAFQAANKGLELIVNVHPEVPDFVLGDPQRLRQCLINLVGNAIKFTKKGEVVIDVCAVGRHDGRVLTHFEVRDTGMGIPDATLKTLFQPFVQADSSTTRHFGGTGLGLSIVRRLVEMMGGQVGVVSKLGEGSNFFFTLSLEPKEDAARKPTQSAIAATGQILIVDDNETNRRVLEALLSHRGYRVATVASGTEALMYLQRRDQRVDMVITDYHMPDMDGAALGERIVSDPALTHLRLVMLTSLDRQGESKHLSALGFAAYLTKPIRTRELFDCVENVLSGEARQWQMEMRPMITRGTLSQEQAKLRFAGDILVVEDNLVNQKVAARFLERMGCTVQIAGHGADGVEAFVNKKFDLILMDLQMPVMDGLTATRAIRDLEKQDARRRTPIIALTANAMRGDQERCEAAGMDGFLTKPIEIERLRDALTKFGLAAGVATAAQPALFEANPEAVLTTPADAVIPPVNLARLNEITDGDQEFARELIETFIASSEAQLTELRAAVDADDRPALARVAHKLKGACANIHAEEMRALIAKLEVDSSTVATSELLAGCALLENAFAKAKEFLNDPSVLPAQVKAAS